MKTFLKMIGLFSGFFILFTLLCIISYVFFFKISVLDIPAPAISNSFSYNEKMEFLRKSKINADIVVIGSSMSLCNISSEVITKKLHSNSFINTASWGMSIKDDFLLLKIISEIHKPSTIILVSNTIDFTEKQIYIDYALLKKFLLSDNTSNFFYHLKNFNLRYYIKYFRYAKKVRSCPQNIDYLGFDNYGTIPLDSSGLKNWNPAYVSTNVKSSQYSYLDSLSIFCKNNSIKLLFFQSPYRYTLHSELNQINVNNLKIHLSTVQKILHRDDHVFITCYETQWADAYFKDSIHFNKIGAQKFTEYCFNKISKISQHFSDTSGQHTIDHL